MLDRAIVASLVAALADTPVIFLDGARQKGKSTLVKAITAGPYPARYLTLDDSTLLAAAIETKASASVDTKDFKGLRALAEDAGDRFLRGIVLSSGPTAVPFAANLHALPTAALWGLGQG